MYLSASSPPLFLESDCDGVNILIANCLSDILLCDDLIQMGGSQVPLQENVSDCGLFLLHYIRKFVENAPRTIKISDVEDRLEDLDVVSFLMIRNYRYCTYALNPTGSQPCFFAASFFSP